MNIMYWIKEYILVFLAYGFVMFVVPEILLRKYLRGRTLTMRICFDSLFSVSAINLIVLIQGLCHVLYPWVTAVIFWAGLVLSLAIPFIVENGTHTLQRFAALLTGGYGLKSFGLNVAKATGNEMEKRKRQVDGKLINHTVLYALLLVIIIYGMIYFSAGVFSTPSYGFGDLYRHHNWIYEMTQGKIFAEGIYPAGLHSFVYLINACFGISAYSILLFLQPIHVSLFMLSIFLLGKELFNWRYTSAIALALFVTLGYGVTNTVFAFSRLQWSLPQEFGAPAALLCPVFLLRYLKEIRRLNGESRRERIYKDENLVVFSLALMTTIVSHFYCTIVAFFLCLAIVPAYFKEIMAKRYFERLLLTVFATVVVAFLPMIAAVPILEARNKKELQSNPNADNQIYQGSLQWGMNVIKGETVDGGTHIVITPTPAPDTPKEDEGALTWKDYAYTIGNNYVEYNYGETFDSEGSQFYLLTAALSLGLVLLTAIIMLIVDLVRKKKGKKRIRLIEFSGYTILFFMLINLMVMSEPGVFGLPRLIASGRLGYYVTIINIFVLMISLDIIMGVTNAFLKDRWDGLIAVVAATAAVILVVFTGHFHGGLYFELTRYNSVVNTTVNIMRENDIGSYTIISPTDEIWQIAGKGRHEELLSLVNGMISEESYKIPTEKVFIFVEKRPIHYAQWYFPDIAPWLGNDSSIRLISEAVGENKVSRGQKDIRNYQINEELSGLLHFDVMVEDVRNYSRPASRVIVESRVMNWIKDFEKLYPRTMKVYYEDEVFVCYYFEQNLDAPYELSLQERNK